MRPLALLFIAVGGCGLTFAPGDYSGPAENVADASAPTSEGGTITDGATTNETSTSSDGGPTSPALHLVLFAGTKDKDVETNDVWMAPVSATGDLGTFGYLQPTPLTKPLQAVAFAGGKLLTVLQGKDTRVVQSTDFANGIVSGWTTATVPNSPTSSYGSFFAKTSLVVVGGQTSADVDDGNGGTTTVTTNHAELLVNKASGAQYPAPNNGASATKLPAGIYAPTSVLYKDFVYLWGAGDDADLASKVYVGKADETLGLASVTATTPITGQDGKAHTPVSPNACAGEGRLFVVGGDKGILTTVSAGINEATGALDTWKFNGNLPAGRIGAGCAVLKGWVYLFGGRIVTANPADAGTLTDEILRAKISADGTLSEWENTAQKLIGPRANVFALTY